MGDVFIVEALRSPFGSYGGNLKDIEAPLLAAEVIKQLINRTGIPKEAIDSLIMGNVLSAGIGQAPARQAAIFAELPFSVDAFGVNKVCGSGLKSIMIGCDSLRLNDANIIIAGGMENMSLAPYYLKKARFGYRMGDGKS